MAHRGSNPRWNARQVDVALGALLATAVLTGLASWSVGDRWNGYLTIAHGTAGLTVALLIPLKLRGSVRTGLRRRRVSRWLSVIFGVVVMVTITLGLVHATGLWFGVGQWTALWTHELAGFVTIPLLLWHFWSRPSRPGFSDLDRRAVLRFAGLGVGALAIHRTQRVLARSVGLAGGTRRDTGSHEVASHDPDRMPSVIWINDNTPGNTDADTWSLTVAGRPVAVSDLGERTRPVEAILDCTGGWYSEQRWDAVPISDLLDDPSGRSVRVTSSTGYSRLFPLGDAAALHLAVGYEGKPLRSDHGAPVRLVVPGRRGPEWVKWVTQVDVSDRPSWLQPPLPLS